MQNPIYFEHVCSCKLQYNTRHAAVDQLDTADITKQKVESRLTRCMQGPLLPYRNVEPGDQDAS